MKVEILKENFKNGLSVTEKIAGKSLSLPILDSVLMEAEDNFLSFCSTDLETAVKIWILTRIIKKGKIAVPVKFLSSFISLLPNEKIALEEKNQNLHIECQNLKNQIRGFNPEEFPLIPQFGNLEYLEVDNKKLCQGLSQVVDIASISQTRPEISGIYFVFLKNSIKIASTDSFRLAEKTIILGSPNKKEYSFILPQKPAKEIINILGEKDGLLKIYFSPHQVMFEFPMKEANRPQIQITSRLIDGEYPNYEEIIPKKFKTHIVLKKDEFLNQIKTASLFSNKINEIKFTVKTESKEIEIFSQNPEVGQNQSVILGKIEGDPMEISFNHKFLIDGLINIKGSEVIFDINKEDGPCVLRPVGDTGYIYVVMPIKAT